MFRRQFLLIACGTALSGCANVPLLNGAAETLRLALADKQARPISRDRVQSLPYASLAVSFGDASPALVVLGRYEGQDLHWISADRVAIVTRGGRVVKTAGLPANLSYTAIRGIDPVVTGLDASTLPAVAHRVIDLQTGGRYGVFIESKLSAAGNEAIDILGLRFDTIKIVERNFAPALDWRFENTFWADGKTGFVWRSVQHVTPEIPAVRIDVLKPAA